jgi:hypothetical protein
VIEHLGLARRPSDRTSQQALDFRLQHGVGFDPNGVKITFFLQQSVERPLGEGRVATKELGDAQVAIPLDHRQEHPPPKLGVAAPLPVSGLEMTAGTAIVRFCTRPFDSFSGLGCSKGKRRPFMLDALSRPDTQHAR